MAKSVDKAKRAAGEAGDEVARSRVTEGLARWGLVARGVLHIAVGLIAVQVARGQSDRRTDSRGAMESLVEKPLGKVLVALLAVGLAGYALWRLVQAVVDPEGRGDGPKGTAKRLGKAALALLYLGLVVSAVQLLLEAGREDPQGEEAFTARLMKLPLGRWLVAVIGVAVVAGGLFNVWRAVSGRYKKRLKDEEMDQEARDVVGVLALIGFTARGIVFGIAGVFLVKAAWEFDPSEGIGLDGSLKQLASESYGPVLLITVACGLVAFGVYCIARARYERVLGN